MLLRALLSALAAGHVARRPVTVESKSFPATRLDTSKPQPIEFDRPFQDILGTLAPEDVWDAFLAKPHTEQLRLLEADLKVLPGPELKRVMASLARELAWPWLPLPGPQIAALTSTADILFYGGGAGSGKSALLCGAAVSGHHRARLFRRESVQVRGLVDEVHKILGNRDGYNGGDHIWRLPQRASGTADAQIEFAHCQYEQDKEKYQGRQADFIAFDELTHFTESMFRYLCTWNRSDREGQRSRVIATGNPPERSDGRWVLAYWAAWLDPSHPRPAREGELRWYTSIDGEDHEVDGPGPHGTDSAGLPIMARSRTFIRGLLRDNPYLLDTGYAATLQSLEEPLRSMLLEGRFDLAVDDDAWQVVPSSWIELAQRRWTIDPPAGATMSCIGVDVAQGGADETVLAARYGAWFAPLKAVKGINTKDGAAVAGLVFATMRDGCQIAVDVGGGWGADAHGHLKQQQLHSVAVNSVEASSAKTRSGNLGFRNLRAEMWWRFREALDPNGAERIALPTDKALAGDLATPCWHRTPSGLIQVEDKGDIRKRLGRSPDRGDAIVMAWAYGGLLEHERRSHGRRPTHANVAHAEIKRHGNSAYSTSGARSSRTARR